MEVKIDQFDARIVHREAAQKVTAEALLLRNKIPKGDIDSPERKARLAFEVTADWFDPDYQGPAENVLRTANHISQNAVIENTWVPENHPWALLVAITNPTASGSPTMLRWMEKPSLRNFH